MSRSALCPGHKVTGSRTPVPSTTEEQGDWPGAPSVTLPLTGTLWGGALFLFLDSSTPSPMKGHHGQRFGEALAPSLALLSRQADLCTRGALTGVHGRRRPREASRWAQAGGLRPPRHPSTERTARVALGPLSLHLLGAVGDALGQRSEAQQESVSLIGLGLLKHGVSPMKVVHHPQHPVALVELEMVVVVEFR